MDDEGQPQALALTKSRASAFRQRHHSTQGDISLSSLSCAFAAIRFVQLGKIYSLRSA